MKRFLIGLFGATSIMGGALAQSTVTMYGLIDMGPTYFKGGQGQTQTRLDSGISFGSRLGFRGSEDLGGGLNAIFNLEMPIRADTGEVPGALWGRESWVGLKSSSWGTLTMGRQTDYMVDFGIWYSGGVLAEGAYGFHPGDYDRVSGQRYDNSIKFTSNKVGPVRGGALVAAGEGVTGRSQSAGIMYDEGPVKASLMYTSIDRLVIDPRNQLGINSLNGANLTGPVTTDRVDIVGTGASYRGDKFGMAAMYTHVNLRLPQGNQALSTVEINAKYQVTPRSFVAASAARSSLENNAWKKYYLTYDYLLSKRTDIYVSYTHLKVSDGNRAILTALPASTGATASALRVGFLHRF